MKRKLQVFISSTYIDLKEERQASVAAVLKAGHIPAGMELFTSGDRSQMLTIKQWIDESDVYMLILGGRYGSIEKTSGISYTELEYDYAVQQEKPLFAVVITEESLETKVKENGTAFIEKENPKELALFRTKVLNNISSFFEDHKDIKLCVHESLADFVTNRNLKGWISADEFIDTKPLFEEISKLSEENRLLKKALENLENQVPNIETTKNNKIERFNELKKVLKAIEIKVPATLTNTNEEEIVDLLRIFYNNKETLINGVTNKMQASNAETFFYANVCPKLQVHSLIINEKVPSVQYRRSYVSNLGNEFLAYLEKSILLKDKDSSEQEVMKKVSEE